MKLAVKNLSNQEVGECDVPDAVFAYPYKEPLIHQVVVAIRAAMRAGTHSTKGRGVVRGGGKKPWRQKGTGRARVGSIRSPLWRSGGVVHGPQPRNYELGVTPREKRNALRSALSRKLSDDQILVLDSFELEGPKTSQLAATLKGLGIEGKALLVDDWNNENLGLASRNNPSLKAVDALGVNVYDVVDRPHLVLSKSALDRLVEVLSK
jgi:large subunit ribosomal protein L4